jgi:hypothetical protein
MVVSWNGVLRIHKENFVEETNRCGNVRGDHRYRISEAVPLLPNDYNRDVLRFGRY